MFWLVDYTAIFYPFGCNTRLVICVVVWLVTFIVGLRLTDIIYCDLIGCYWDIVQLPLQVSSHTLWLVGYSWVYAPLQLHCNLFLQFSLLHTHTHTPPLPQICNHTYRLPTHTLHTSHRLPGSGSHIYLFVHGSHRLHWLYYVHTVTTVLTVHTLPVGCHYPLHHTPATHTHVHLLRTHAACHARTPHTHRTPACTRTLHALLHARTHTSLTTSHHTTTYRYAVQFWFIGSTVVQRYIWVDLVNVYVGHIVPYIPLYLQFTFPLPLVSWLITLGYLRW